MKNLASVVLTAALTPLAVNAMTATPLNPMQIQVQKASASNTKRPDPMSFSRKVLLTLALAIVLPLATQACSVDATPPTVDPITPSSATIDNPTAFYGGVGPNSFPDSFGG